VTAVLSVLLALVVLVEALRQVDRATSRARVRALRESTARARRVQLARVVEVAREHVPAEELAGALIVDPADTAPRRRGPLTVEELDEVLDEALSAPERAS
jgi:hypothetical protein